MAVVSAFSRQSSINSPECTLMPSETGGTMELIAEMAALGLPTSFVAKPEAPKKGKRKLAERKSSAEACQLRDETPTPSVEFFIRAVRLYTHADATLEVDDLDTGQDLLSFVDESILVCAEPISAVGDCSQSGQDSPQSGKESSSAEVRSVYKEANGEATWEPIWDEQYQCYYFYNSETSESTWEAPRGYERHVSDASISDDNLCLGLNFKVISEEQGRHSSGLSTLAMAEQSAPSSSDEGDVLGCQGEDVGRTVQELRSCVNFDVDDSITAGRGDVRDTVVVEITGSLPKGCGSHIRFSDSIEESSGDDKEIDWEEIKLPTSIELSRDSWHEERGLDSCSPSQEWTSRVHAKQNRQRLQVVLKKRRLKSFPSEGEELDKVLLPGMTEMMSRSVVKYWFQRYSLFTRYDEGIKMDEEGWFSVTPEIIARHQASRFPTGLVVDAFTGVGGNAIQFALRGHHVIAIDIDPVRVLYARHNAEIYGVADNIDFIIGDFFELAPSLKADVVFLSPPWGGPEYLKEESYDLQAMLQPKDGFTLFKVAQLVAPNIALFMPRNVNLDQLQELSWLSSPPLPCEVEKNFVNDKLKAITAYYGEIVSQENSLL